MKAIVFAFQKLQTLTKLLNSKNFPTRLAKSWLSVEGLVQKQSSGGPMARCQLIAERSGLNVISIGHRGPPLLWAVWHPGSDVTVAIKIIKISFNNWQSPCYLWKYTDKFEFIEFWARIWSIFNAYSTLSLFTRRSP